MSIQFQIIGVVARYRRTKTTLVLPPPIVPKNTLVELGILERARFDMAEALEEHFKISLEREEISAWETVKNVFDSVINQLPKPEPFPRFFDVLRAINMKDEARLTELIPRSVGEGFDASTADLYHATHLFMCDMTETEAVGVMRNSWLMREKMNRPDYLRSLLNEAKKAAGKSTPDRVETDDERIKRLMPAYQTNIGHGHVWTRPDGMRARCGGPALCTACARDKSWVDAARIGDTDTIEKVTAPVETDEERLQKPWLEAASVKPKPAINGIQKQDVDDFRNGNYCERTALDQYQHIATKSAIYPGQGTALGLVYVALKLNGEAGEFAEHVGKAMRDDALTVDRGDMMTFIDGRGLTAARKELLIKEVGDVLWYLSAACNELGISLTSAATANLEKLHDRTQRDALRGSGDER